MRLHTFFKWAAEEVEIKTSPIANTNPPAIPEEPLAILDKVDPRRLLCQYESKNSESRRETEIIGLLLDAGMRRADLFGLKVEDVDLEHNIAVVLGKGRRLRSCPLGKRMAQAVDRYYPRERPTSMLPARTVACA